MGWGCYKHEWDHGSEAWMEEATKLAEEMLARPRPRTWGRNTEVCPLCWRELEAERNTLRQRVEELEREREIKRGEYNDRLASERMKLDRLAEALMEAQPWVRIGTMYQRNAALLAEVGRGASKETQGRTIPAQDGDQKEDR